MEIKLRARLSAYSKLESIEEIHNLASVPAAAIDKLFNNVEDTLVTPGDIDALFPAVEPDKVISKEEIDKLFTVTEDNTRRVTESEIDKLFQ